MTTTRRSRTNAATARERRIVQQLRLFGYGAWLEMAGRDPIGDAQSHLARYAATISTGLDAMRSGPAAGSSDVAAAAAAIAGDAKTLLDLIDALPEYPLTPQAAQKRLAAGGAMVDVAAEIQVAEKRAAALLAAREAAQLKTIAALASAIAGETPVDDGNVAGAAAVGTTTITASSSSSSSSVASSR